MNPEVISCRNRFKVTECGKFRIFKRREPETTGKRVI
jgi:hypothetical protein